MIERFKGAAGERRLVAALSSQDLVRGDEAVAEELAKVVTLHKINAGKKLISQHGKDNDLYFILCGTAAVFVHGRVVATRTDRCHVGEMALIDPTAPRSATVKATTTMVVAKISEPEFTLIADKFPNLWRRIAVELAKRLREREKFHSLPNAKPSVFIGSSRESLAVAQELQKGLQGDSLSVTLWTDDDVFLPSRFTIEDLLTQVKGADFAILVLGQDDSVISRKKKTLAPRDNVVFELGLFMGVLDRPRTFIVKPKGLETKIPSDLLGLTPLEYDLCSSPGSRDNLTAVCAKIRNLIHQLGPR